ncbi:MAG: GNAT family N-acetyltransferase [Planctomycetaceae bacterium]|nr:GNAT family N-acetyltransferase [Planctomycetaceae bacterium]
MRGGQLASTLTPQSLQQLLLDEAAPLRCLVVEQAGELLGYATFAPQWSTWHAARYLYLDCLYLQSEARGQGLGRQIMDRIAAAARSLGCGHVEWQTPADNQSAIAFYEHIGASAKKKQRFTWPLQAHSGESTSSAGESVGILPPPASLADPYCDRPTLCTERRTWQEGLLKVYQISRDGRRLPDGRVEAAMRCLSQHVSWPQESVHKFGFLTLNLGEQALWALAQMWASDILRQFCFYAPLDRPEHFQPAPMPGFNACVWELEVTRHERDAWVRHVMTHPAAPRFEDYLNDTLTIPVS